MHVRIRWFGDGARLTARRLQEWLPSLLPGSTADLRDGRAEPDARARLSALREADFTLFVVAGDGRDAPWAAFEAGALAATRRPARILGIGSAARATPGPLGAFESSPFDEEGFLQAALHLARVAGEEPEHLKANLQLLWPMIGGLPLTDSNAPELDVLDEPTITRGRLQEFAVTEPDPRRARPEPLRWAGQYRGYLPGDTYQLDMRVEVAAVGGRFEGQAFFEGRRNAVLDVHGERTRAVDEASASWRRFLRQLGDATPVGLLYFWDAQAAGDRLEVGGIYRCVILDDGALHGLWFRSGQASPIGEFELTPDADASLMNG